MFLIVLSKTKMHLQALPVKSQIIEIKHLLECTCLWHFSVLWGKQLPSYIMLAVNAAAIECVLSIASIFQVKTMLKFGIMYLFGCDPKQQQLKQDSLFLSCVNGSLGRQSRATATLQGQGVQVPSVLLLPVLNLVAEPAPARNVL